MPRIISRRGLLAGMLGMGGGALLCGCNGPELADKLMGRQESTPYSGSTFAFDTYCTFTVYGDEAAPAKLAQACTRLDGLFNLYDEGSDIARVNAAAGAIVTVDTETAELVSRALTFCEAADGLFDITIGAVSTLWDFAEHVRPTAEQIASALAHVNWRCVNVDIDASTIQLADPAAKLDLGAIAKGYAADRLCDILRDETQATAAAISLGGNIIYFGKKPDGIPWETGIRDPNDPGGKTVIGTCKVDGGTLVTSGLYERTFEQDSVTYWHILDPKTGMPVQTDVESDTVFCDSSTQADALSTTLFVAGSERGAQIIEGMDGTAAYFIRQDGTTSETSAWQQLTDFSA